MHTRRQSCSRLIVYNVRIIICKVLPLQSTANIIWCAKRDVLVDAIVVRRSVCVCEHMSVYSIYGLFHVCVCLSVLSALFVNTKYSYTLFTLRLHTTYSLKSIKRVHSIYTTVRQVYMYCIYQFALLKRSHARRARARSTYSRYHYIHSVSVLSSVVHNQQQLGSMLVFCASVC